MTHRRGYAATLCALALSFLFTSCGDDSTGPEGSGPPPEDFSGWWNLNSEIVSKSTCGGTIGDQNPFILPIAQDGRQATAIIDNRIPVDLAIRGSKATGSWTDGTVTTDIELTVDGSNMTGTQTRTDTNCTEVSSLTGTLRGAAPSSDFAGNWDLDIDVYNSQCVSEPIGSSAQICRTIRVNDNTISIEDTDGVIRGVADGTFAQLWRFNEDETLEVSLSVSSGSLSGQIGSLDLVNDCQVYSDLSGTLREGPCPAPASPSDFVGNWFVDVNRFSRSGCSFPTTDDFIGLCMTVTADGTDIVADDGAGLGPLEGAVEGSAAILPRTDADGVTSLRLEFVDSVLTGELTKVFTSGNCSGSDVEIDFDGSPLSTPCSASGGPFAGFWSIDGQFTSNGCGLPAPTPTCSQIFQSGNTVFIVDQSEQGTVSGNTATFHQVEESTELGLRITYDIFLQLLSGSDSFTGTESLTFESLTNPNDTCTTTADLFGTRTTGCDQAVASSSDSRMMGLGLRVPKTR